MAIGPIQLLRQANPEQCRTLLAAAAHGLLSLSGPGVASLRAPWRTFVSAAASLAVEAESRCTDGLGLLLFPVHLFLPVSVRALWQAHFPELASTA